MHSARHTAHHNMDFDFPTIDEIASANQQTQPASMNNLLNANPSMPAYSQPLPWTSTNTADLPPLPLHPPQQQQPHHSSKRRAPIPDSKQPLHHSHPHSHSHFPPANHPQHLHSHSPPQTAVTTASTASGASILPIDSPPIDPHVVDQMGGLGYADLCKERARERFKEKKKNEHMANGDFDRIRRRKKGDTSMDAKQRYTRRLRMNQDSAAAARHAQEVYVHVLEKLVKTSEEEKKVMAMELAQLRQQNKTVEEEKRAMAMEVNQLREQTNVVNNRLASLEDSNNQSTNDPSAIYDAADGRRYDAFQVAKLVDMLTTPEPVSAQAQDRDFAEGRMGIQPSRAV